uniref:Uncharacterized protein n=1 Tax=viral metagenome TaxID=1070528 RepID=A0A6C0K4S8_9ZZZZ
MGKKASIETSRLSWMDSFSITGNIAIFALINTLAGAILSYILWYAFDPYDEEDEKTMKVWEDKGLPFQLLDITLELVIIAVTAFWLAYYLNNAPPIIPVRKGLESDITSYTSGMFFMFAVFIFLNDLTEKLKYVFNFILGDWFDYFIPEEGSLLDATVSYSERQRRLHAAQKRHATK